MTIQEFVQLAGAKRIRNGQYLALCPSHRDRKPSLSIREGKRAILLKCWSQNCTAKEITAALGIRLGDLWYLQRTDPKAIREAEKKRREEDQVTQTITSSIHWHQNYLERWSRVSTALGYLLMKNPSSDSLAQAFAYALECSREVPARCHLLKPPAYSPFPHTKLLTGIQANEVTPQIARLLKLI